MGMHIRFGLSGTALAAALLLAPALAAAQTPEPAAGNPAINNTPAPDNAKTPSPSSQGMASPSSEATIPKGSNPNSGNGNLAPGSGGTPSSSASDNSMPGQTGANAQSGVNDSKPSQTATNPDAGTTSGSSNSDRNVDSMPQGKYTSPPTDTPSVTH